MHVRAQETKINNFCSEQNLDPLYGILLSERFIEY